MEDLNRRMLALESRVDKFIERFDVVESKLDALIGKTDLVTTVIKFIVLPLIMILGGLVGIKFVFPTS